MIWEYIYICIHMSSYLELGGCHVLATGPQMHPAEFGNDAAYIC